MRLSTRVRRNPPQPPPSVDLYVKPLRSVLSELSFQYRSCPNCLRPARRYRYERYESANPECRVTFPDDVINLLEPCTLCYRTEWVFSDIHSGTRDVYPSRPDALIFSSNFRVDRWNGTSPTNRDAPRPGVSRWWRRVTRVCLCCSKYFFDILPPANTEHNINCLSTQKIA